MVHRPAARPEALPLGVLLPEARPPVRLRPAVLVDRPAELLLRVLPPARLAELPPAELPPAELPLVAHPAPLEVLLPEVRLLEALRPEALRPEALPRLAAWHSRRPWR